jgi:hypothetical protein
LTNHKSIRSSRYFAAVTLSQAVRLFGTFDTWGGTGSDEAARAGDMQTANNSRASIVRQNLMVYTVATAKLRVKALVLMRQYGHGWLMKIPGHEIVWS